MHGTLPPERKRPNAPPLELPDHAVSLTRRLATRRHRRVAVALHTTTLAAVVLLAVTGVLFGWVEPGASNPRRALLAAFHGSLGVTVLVLLASRPLLWLVHRPAPSPVAGSGAERLAATAFKLLFFALLLILPLTGWIANDASARPFPVWGIGDLPDLYRFDTATRRPVLFGVVPVPLEFADARQAARGALALHRWLGALLAVLVGLHLVALAARSRRR